MDAGPSAYDGGPGDDTVSYTAGSDSASGVQVHATDGTDATVDRGNQVIDHTAGIETIVGTSGNDRFYGSGDADHFVGGGGIDWFLPQGGDDVIDGGGDLGDTLSVAASLAPVTFDMTNQQATGEGTDTFAGVDVLVGSAGDDTFIGDPEAHDIVNIEGGGGRDTLDLSAAATGQSVYLSNSYPPAWLWAADISRVIGSPYRDRFFFSAGGVPAHFAGREGNDRLQGGPLDDTLKGGPGDDRILGKGGTDTCVGGPGSDTITGCELP
jgi:Ca2+-binding RTX toxin-like protein